LIAEIEAMNLIKTRSAQCSTVAFFQNGSQPHVPLFTLPVTIGSAGELLDIEGRFVLSCRPDASQGYPGFPHPYFAAGGLFLTAQDPSQLSDVPLSSGTFLDEPSGEDGWLGGGTDQSPMHPYTNHIRLAKYVTTAADIGQRWLTMLTWCSSSYAGPSDYLLHETMQSELVVEQSTGATSATVSAPAPVSPPPQPPIVVAPPPPAPVSPPPPPAPLSMWQSIWNFLTNR
jgi:hypothetical protein